MLTKDSATVLVSPASPGAPAVPGAAFMLYAPPPPKGMRYNTPLPTSMAAFAQWKQLIPADTGGAEPNYLSADDFLAKYGVGGGVSGWTPVTNQYGELVGFMRDPQLPPAPVWFNAPAGMTYMEARNAGSVSPNGYPLDGKDHDFYFRIAGVEYAARYRHGNARGYYFGRWLTAQPPEGYQIRGWTGVVATPNVPDTPAIPGTPAKYRIETFDGWNAGGNSVDRLDGDVQTTFYLDVRGAIVIGIAPSGTVPAGRFERITHAFYADTAADGSPRAAVMEQGLVVGNAIPITTDTKFQIRRDGGEVSYYINDVLIRTSPTPSSGEVMVSSALYRGGDKVL